MVLVPSEGSLPAVLSPSWLQGFSGTEAKQNRPPPLQQSTWLKASLRQRDLSAFRFILYWHLGLVATGFDFKVLVRNFRAEW